MFKTKASSPLETIAGIKQNKRRYIPKNPIHTRRPNGSVDYACPSCLVYGEEEPFEIKEIVNKNPFTCYWTCKKCGCEGFHTDIGDKPFEAVKARFMTT